MRRLTLLTPQDAPAVLTLQIPPAAAPPRLVHVAAGVIRITRRGAPAPDATGVYRVLPAVIGAPSASSVLQHWEIEADGTAHRIGGFSHELLRRLLAAPPARSFQTDEVAGCAWRKTTGGLGPRARRA